MSEQLQHVVSVMPVNVAPTEDDPRTVAWRFMCTCMKRPPRNYLMSVERADAERWGQGHLKTVGALPSQTTTASILGVSGRNVPVDTTRTGNGAP